MRSLSSVAHEKSLQMQVKGKTLHLRYQGRSHTFRLSCGWKHLLALMSHPDQPISFQLLDAYPEIPDARYRQFGTQAELLEQDLHIQEYFPRQNLVDGATIRQVKNRLLQIVEQLALMQEDCNYPACDELLAEQEKLCAYLKEVYRPIGLGCHFSDAYTLLHRRVWKALRRSFTELSRVEPNLARLLRSSLVGSDTLAYHPRDLDVQIDGF